jgi:hypothetical protein
VLRDHALTCQLQVSDLRWSATGHGAHCDVGATSGGHGTTSGGRGSASTRTATFCAAQRATSGHSYRRRASQFRHCGRKELASSSCNLPRRVPQCSCSSPPSSSDFMDALEWPRHVFAAFKHVLDIAAAPEIPSQAVITVLPPESVRCRLSRVCYSSP